MNLQRQIRRFYEGRTPLLAAKLKVDPGLHLSSYCCPHLPYVGDWYETAETRVMVVGKATNGWDYPDIDPECKTLEDICKARVLPDLLEWSRRFVIDDDQSPYFSGKEAKHRRTATSFWWGIYKVVPGILDRGGNVREERNPIDAERCFKSIAWTNLFKIGKRTGNPDRPMEQFLCQRPFDELLANEIEILKPDVILFSTGPNFDWVINKMLPDVQIKPLEERIAQVTWPRTAFCGLRTDHFQYKFNPERILRHVLAHSPWPRSAGGAQ